MLFMMAANLYTIRMILVYARCGGYGIYNVVGGAGTLLGL